ncbi:hypothetical protein CH302_19295 [Rhodococcus sp. 15-2388-1-1a]|uniref:hypothetical protein n=1 Tax=Nocardiaceae TaxID=85025 RepID=UPI00055F76DD|nr:MULTISPECIES: hypothetical protein [Rhodococcus]OZE95087.1 hypothetical protein CH302_19295 [Rhodococcus sp. 15-2388-1-1a]
MPPRARAKKETELAVEPDVSAADVLDRDVDDVEPLVIPDDLQFGTDDVEGDLADRKTITFSIGSHALEAYEPTRGSMLVLMGSLSRNATEFDQINGILGFFSTVLTPISKDWLWRYIERPDFDENILMDVIEGLAKHWHAEDLLPKNQKNRADRRAAAKKSSKN